MPHDTERPGRLRLEVPQLSRQDATIRATVIGEERHRNCLWRIRNGAEQGLAKIAPDTSDHLGGGSVRGWSLCPPAGRGRLKPRWR